MKSSEIKLTREELYEKVWSVPTTKLAKELGISDVALGKICKKLNIPKPFPGYWQQVAAGRQVKREKLPPIKQSVPTIAYIQPRQPVTVFKPESQQILEQIKWEEQVVNKIIVGETLHNPHPLVRCAKQVLENSKPDDYGRLRPLRVQSCLDVCLKNIASPCATYYGRSLKSFRSKRVLC